MAHAGLSTSDVSDASRFFSTSTNDITGATSLDGLDELSRRDSDVNGPGSGQPIETLLKNDKNNGEHAVFQ